MGIQAKEEPMVLTKAGIGHFTGAVGANANLTLVGRDSTVPIQVISVVYGTTTLNASGNNFTLPVAQGEQSLTVVYGATQQGALVDLIETDATGKQTIRTDGFNPERPTLQVWIEGI
jgi:hypothetical protein